MVGYVRYHIIRDLPIGIEVNFKLWVFTEPDRYYGDDWVKISFNKKDVRSFGWNGCVIRKGIILELV